MRIGVVCEGPTDFPAISHFVGHALKNYGVDASFHKLFPEPDRTRPDGGWANVLLWLGKYPPEVRVPQYFGAGLFAGALSSSRLDAILVHLDADVLNDDGFRAFALSNYGLVLITAEQPLERAEEVRKVLS